MRVSTAILAKMYPIIKGEKRFFLMDDTKIEEI